PDLPPRNTTRVDARLARPVAWAVRTAPRPGAGTSEGKPRVPAFRIVGPGRAGTSMALALAECGWQHKGSLGRGDDLSDAAAGVDLCLIATPDGVVGDVARVIRVSEQAVVAHM